MVPAEPLELSELRLPISTTTNSASQEDEDPNNLFGLSSPWTDSDVAEFVNTFLADYPDPTTVPAVSSQESPTIELHNRQISDNSSTETASSLGVDPRSSSELTGRQSFVSSVEPLSLSSASVSVQPASSSGVSSRINSAAPAYRRSRAGTSRTSVEGGLVNRSPPPSYSYSPLYPSSTRFGPSRCRAGASESGVAEAPPTTEHQRLKRPRVFRPPTQSIHLLNPAPQLTPTLSHHSVASCIRTFVTLVDTPFRPKCCGPQACSRADCRNKPQNIPTYYRAVLGTILIIPQGPDHPNSFLKILYPLLRTSMLTFWLLLLQC